MADLVGAQIDAVPGAQRAQGEIGEARYLGLDIDVRVPRLAQRRVILFFWPTRASSSNQISTGVPFGRLALTFASASAKPPF